MAADRQSYLSEKDLDLPSGRVVVPAEVRGEFILITDAEQDKFEVNIDGTGWIPCFLGFKRRLVAGSKFRSLAFRSKLAQTIQYIAGNGDYDDSRLNMIRGRMNPVMDAESVVTGHSQTIAAATTINLGTAPPPGPRYVRRATIVFNMDPAVDLNLLNQSDELLAPVLFRQGVNLQTSAALKVQNPSGAPVVCTVSQIWYIVN